MEWRDKILCLLGILYGELGVYFLLGIDGSLLGYCGIIGGYVLVY